MTIRQRSDGWNFSEDPFCSGRQPADDSQKSLYLAKFGQRPAIPCRLAPTVHHRDRSYCAEHATFALLDAPNSETHAFRFGSILTRAIRAGQLTWEELRTFDRDQLRLYVRSLGVTGAELIIRYRDLGRIEFPPPRAASMPDDDYADAFLAHLR